MIPVECDKCKDLRGVDTLTHLDMCDNRTACLKIRLCEYHCYETYSMCSMCLNFIQDPENDQRLREWEKRHGDKSS